MKLQSLSDLEKSIGGRPKSDKKKVRMTFYLSEDEAQLLRAKATEKSLGMSQLVRTLVTVELHSS